MSLTIDLGFHSTEWISMSKEFIRSKFFRDAGWVRLQKKILKNKAGYSWMEYYVLLSTHPGENNRNLRPGKSTAGISLTFAEFNRSSRKMIEQEKSNGYIRTCKTNKKI